MGQIDGRCGFAHAALVRIAGDDLHLVPQISRVPRHAPKITCDTPLPIGQEQHMWNLPQSA
jgi:hypothetical protein